MSESPDEAHERGYVTGHRAARRYMLMYLLRELDHAEVVDMDTAVRLARRVAEREGAIAALRRICAAHGDNEWPSDLSLIDIIEKHLEPHL